MALNLLYSEWKCTKSKIYNHPTDKSPLTQLPFYYFKKRESLHAWFQKKTPQTVKINICARRSYSQHKTAFRLNTLSNGAGREIYSQLRVE